MFNRSYIDGHKGHPEYLTDTQIKSLMQKVKLSTEDTKLILIIKHLSDPTKFKLYLILRSVKEIPVTDITHILALSQSSVSHALSDLKNIGLVESHRCGQLICYSLTKNKQVNKLAHFLSMFSFQK